MAFLCPVRIRRGKKKKSSSGDSDKDLSRPGSGLSPGMGRITGSASIETLVRVGIEKEHGLSPDSKMVVLHDFTPCVDDELEVRLSVSDGVTNDGHSELGSEGEACPFSKDPSVLNREDPDWYWIVRSDGQEGFIPSGFVYPAVVQASPQDTTQPVLSPATTNSNTSVLNNSKLNSSAPPQDNDGRYHGTELVMLYDYKAQAPDDLSVKRGEWVYADLTQQTVEGWLWAHAPKSRRSGFIPTAYARAPHTTSL
ncbi:hypothetical protein HF086_000164 [Spodoptera exigua]|uniref:SH3 domain-containing protein n=1 Tax=Spodoptera exigua TaxID=7107 RepID=A0A922MM18_SPOEX|nr:hypothetical protein HF086_000164 [Spodoptera exigua]